jgi:hypothetical protein
MKNFIQLTRPNGDVFMANINYIVSVSDIEGTKPNENTYIFGLGNNGGCFVVEWYDKILTLIENAQEPNQ